jgi:class 3 adenylate cyclase
VTGTRTILLTDVVDSTLITERVGDARMAQVWVAHDRLARDLLAAHGGVEADRTDGFLMLFEEVSDAVGFAVAFHAGLRRLSGETGVPLRARVGIHVGEVIVIETPASDRARGAKPIEVEGLAKPAAARVMSVALGGQTLLSAAARQALGETGLRVCSHGFWRMKGVSEPMELFEAGDTEAPFTPPPDGAKVYRVVQRDGRWLPVHEVRHSLPAERDLFVGREADLQALAKRLDEGARLVTVLGIGGTGKTRLVTHFAWT